MAARIYPAGGEESSLVRSCRWARKVTLDEFVVTETTLPARPGQTRAKVRSIIERKLIIRTVTAEEFSRR